MVSLYQDDEHRSGDDVAVYCLPYIYDRPFGATEQEARGHTAMTAKEGHPSIHRAPAPASA